MPCPSISTAPSPHTRFPVLAPPAVSFMGLSVVKWVNASEKLVSLPKMRTQRAHQKHQMWLSTFIYWTGQSMHTWTRKTELTKRQLRKVSQFSSVAQSCPTLRPHESQHARPPCPSPTPGVHSNSCPSRQWCHPTISSSVVPFSCLHLSQHQDLFQGVISSHQAAKVLEFQLQHQSFQLIFRTDSL